MFHFIVCRLHLCLVVKFADYLQSLLTLAFCDEPELYEIGIELSSFFVFIHSILWTLLLVVNAKILTRKYNIVREERYDYCSKVVDLTSLIITSTGLVLQNVSHLICICIWNACTKNIADKPFTNSLGAFVYVWQFVCSSCYDAFAPCRN